MNYTSELNIYDMVVEVVGGVVSYSPNEFDPLKLIKMHLAYRCHAAAFGKVPFLKWGYCE